MIDREQFLNTQITKTKPAEVEGWPAGTLIREISAMERVRLHERTVDLYESEKDEDEVMALAIGCTYFISDEDGNRLLQDGDEQELVKRTFSALYGLFLAGMRFSAITTDEKEKSLKKSRKAS